MALIKDQAARIGGGLGPLGPPLPTPLLPPAPQQQQRNQTHLHRKYINNKQNNEEQQGNRTTLIGSKCILANTSIILFILRNTIQLTRPKDNGMETKNK